MSCDGGLRGDFPARYENSLPSQLHVTKLNAPSNNAKAALLLYPQAKIACFGLC